MLVLTSIIMSIAVLKLRGVLGPIFRVYFAHLILTLATNLVFIGRDLTTFLSVVRPLPGGPIMKSRGV